VAPLARIIQAVRVGIFNAALLDTPPERWDVAARSCWSGERTERPMCEVRLMVLSNWKDGNRSPDRSATRHRLVSRPHEQKSATGVWAQRSLLTDEVITECLSRTSRSALSSARIFVLVRPKRCRSQWFRSAA
jgi:hypothetical protein